MSEIIPPTELDILSDSVDPELERETIAKHISTIVSQLDTQERMTRDRMLRLWKYLELLWEGSGNYYWDHTTGQWRAITQEDLSLIANEADIDPTLVNKTINLIRPYGESLAGVLTTGLPRVRYYPEDADNELDIEASKAYTNVEKKIVADNQIQIKMVEILVKIWNGGFAAAYNYTHQDKKYGEYTEPVLGNRDFDVQSLICSSCGNEITTSETEIPPKVDNAEEESAEYSDQSLEEQQKPDVEVETPQIPEMQMQMCPICMSETEHLVNNNQITKEVEIGQNQIPKSRQIIQIYGPMNVKISALATRKEHVYWLILEEDLDYAYARCLYPDHRDKIAPTTSSILDIDRLARSRYEIGENTLKEAATIRKVWLKPAAYEKLETLADVEMMKSKYPNGIMAIFCADTFLEAEEENMDDHWTISINPLYPRVQADPLGKALIGCHEVGNDLFQLEVDAVRYAIPMTFADPNSLDFESYSQTRALPGSVTPMKKPAGGKLQDAIAELKTSTLPQGIEYLDGKVEKLIQFISGVLPSVFGGVATGSKTLGEYQESRNQALQRLSLIWKVVSVMYAEMMAKSTKQYVDNLREDERFVMPNGRSNYMNVWLKKETFQNGKIGEVRAELSEQFPTTWPQISAKIMELLGLNNELITSYLLHPENIELIYQALGIDDLYVPGEDQRNKQLHEIGEIIQESMPGMDQVSGMPIPPMPFNYPVEQIDNHQLHMEVIAAFLNSPVGIDLKNTNPVAYGNVLSHYNLHMIQFQVQQAAAQAQEQEAEKSNSDSEYEKTEEASA